MNTKSAKTSSSRISIGPSARPSSRCTAAGSARPPWTPAIAIQSEEKKRRIYPHVVAGYRKFLASGDKRWFEPPHGGLALGDLEINLNPEVGFLIDKKPHLVKLYFRQEPLHAKRVATTLALITSGLGRAFPRHAFAMLDVQRGKLHTSAAAPNPRLFVLLRGEAASFSTIYAAL